jgi:excisionase family DNA binding protein
MSQRIGSASSVLLSPAALAATLDVPVARVYELVRPGTLGSIRIGRLIRFRPETVDAFLAAGGERALADAAYV